MQIHFKLNDKVTIVAEGTEMTDIFEQLAQATEVFNNVVAKKKDYDGECREVYPVVRTDAEDNKYYELHSKKVWKVGDKWKPMKKAFGCNKKGGGLFPKRKDKEDNYLPDNGWMIYNPATNKEE